MKISVITVCFNAGRVIADCLRSVADQTYTDIEHIIIDGKSTDNTVEIVKRFPHVKTLTSEVDSGIYNAMNKGVLQATGDFIIFLNADDMFSTPNALQSAAEAISDLSDVDVVYGNLLVRKLDGSTLVFSPPSPDKASELMVCGCLPHQSTFARPRVFQRTDGFDERYRVHAEYDWYLKILADPEINVRHINCVIGSYFEGGTSSNLAVGQPEVFEIQNSSSLYNSSEWDKKRISIYQEQVLNLRLEIERIRELSRIPKKRGIRQILRSLPAPGIGKSRFN